MLEVAPNQQLEVSEALIRLRHNEHFTRLLRWLKAEEMRFYQVNLFEKDEGQSNRYKGAGQTIRRLAELYEEAPETYEKSKQNYE